MNKNTAGIDRREYIAMCIDPPERAGYCLAR